MFEENWVVILLFLDVVVVIELFIGLFISFCSATGSVPDAAQGRKQPGPAGLFSVFVVFLFLCWLFQLNWAFFGFEVCKQVVLLLLLFELAVSRRSTVTEKFVR